MLIIYGSSSHLRSAHENARKCVGIPNCLIITTTSYKNCFQYAVVPLTELIKENRFSLGTNLSIVPLKLFLTVSTVSVPGLNLCIAKLVDKRKWCWSYTDLTNNIDSAFDAQY